MGYVIKVATSPEPLLEAMSLNPTQQFINRPEILNFHVQAKEDNSHGTLMGLLLT